MKLDRAASKAPGVASGAGSAWGLGNFIAIPVKRSVGSFCGYERDAGWYDMLRNDPVIISADRIVNHFETPSYIRSSVNPR